MSFESTRMPRRAEGLADAGGAGEQVGRGGDAGPAGDLGQRRRQQPLRAEVLDHGSHSTRRRGRQSGSGFILTPRPGRSARALGGQAEPDPGSLSLSLSSPADGQPAISNRSDGLSASRSGRHRAVSPDVSNGTVSSLRRIEARDPSARLLADDVTSGPLLWRLPSLDGRIAFDPQLVVVSQAALNRYADFLLGRPDWLAVSRHYSVIVVSKTGNPPLGGTDAHSAALVACLPGHDRCRLHS